MNRQDAEMIFMAAARKAAPSMPESDLVHDVAAMFDEAVRIDQPMEDVLHGMVVIVNMWAKTYEGAYPDHDLSLGMDSFDWLDSLPTKELINVWYPEASSVDKARLLDLAEGSDINNWSIASGIAMSSVNEGFTVDDVIVSIRAESQKGGGTGIPAPDNDAGEDIVDGIVLPESPLYFEGLETQHLDFLVGLYVGSFNRAPEYSGLKYWAAELRELIDTEHPAPLLEMASRIYWAGAENGEIGTQMSDSDYILSLYENALGREANPEGHQYWLDELDQGKLDRPSLLTTILMAAMEHERDAQQIEMRVAVAKFVAQEHVTGAHIENHGIDLVAVVNGLHGKSDAIARIEGIVAQHGDAPWMEAVAEALSDHQAYGEDFTSQDLAPIELVGLAIYSGEAQADYLM